MWQELAPKLKQALITYATNTENCPWRQDYKATTDVTFEKMLGEDGLYRVTMEALPGHPVIRYRRLPKVALEASDLQPYMKTWAGGELELTIDVDTKMTRESVIQQYVFHGSVLRIGGKSELLQQIVATFRLPPEKFAQLDLQKEAATVREMYMGMQQRFSHMPFDELKAEFRHILDIFQPGEAPNIPADKMKVHVGAPFLWISSIDGIHPPLWERI
jgi:hypothetical protein